VLVDGPELSYRVRRSAHVFEGGGFGVGLTVTELGRVPPPEVLAAGVVARPSRLGEVLPVGSRSDAEIALELGRVRDARSMLAAYEAELVLALAAQRPDALDRADGEPGAGPGAGCAEPGSGDE
jgi:hypothetical protein